MTLLFMIPWVSCQPPICPVCHQVTEWEGCNQLGGKVVLHCLCCVPFLLSNSRTLFIYWTGNATKVAHDAVNRWTGEPPLTCCAGAILKCISYCDESIHFWTIPGSATHPIQEWHRDIRDQMLVDVDRHWLNSAWYSLQTMYLHYRSGAPPNFQKPGRSWMSCIMRYFSNTSLLLSASVESEICENWTQFNEYHLQKTKEDDI